MDFGLAPVVREAVQQVTDAGLFGYLPPRLGAEMQQATADYYARHHGWEVPVEHVRPLPDVLAGLTAVMEHFARPGAVVVLTPAYMPFLTLPGMAGREVVEVPMLRSSDPSGMLRSSDPAGTGDDWSLDLAAVDAAFAAGATMLVLCNPHNPIGKVYRAEELRALAEVVSRHDGFVFNDEIHAPLVFSGHRHVPYPTVSPEAAAHTVTATSASKSWNLPGLKCAQLIHSDPDLAARWAEVGVMAEHGASNPGVVANTAAYTRGQEWLDDVLRYLDGNRQLLRRWAQEHAPQVAVTVPDGTYLAWLDCTALGLERPAEHIAEQAGVALVDGALCGAAGAGCVRLNLATPRPVLSEILSRLDSVLTR
ncbi:aminotransferase class I/II-fold pyridoxal phosphate-dependent enzyme [Auraticoccus sp. F435]|uniref:cysteine-S-conjugate beta-lyase n=2 Tax=Auraticoccus cholistanensis TaxID=2656650 RepID=A0A6A9UT44_9ACTN|nr:aminotransferase class I/II-fold pyridoxal phosphate-dependent enzyme [Auraticoccus cholistanensis]MVA74905.1 aminotransferase class I/II-fold pyridoxal phosphate-dependent enzyme [Auraticoccus cholistanensis]